STQRRVPFVVLDTSSIQPPLAPPPNSSPSQPYKRFSDNWSPPIAHVFGSSPQGSRAGMLNNAEIVVWQSSRRLLFASAVGSVAALLRFTGLVAGPVWPILVIVP